VRNCGQHNLTSWLYSQFEQLLCSRYDRAALTSDCHPLTQFTMSKTLTVVDKQNRMEDHTGPLSNLSHAASDIITLVLGSIPLRERFVCALVCKAWAEAAVAATDSIILEHRMQDLSSLQHWLEKHGNRLEVLQLHACYKAALTELPCCAKLQGLLLHGLYPTSGYDVSIDIRTWGDIASATKLTSIYISNVHTAFQQADVVAALTALPNLEQLTWHYVRCSNEERLSNSSLLQQMMQLTSLDLQGVTAAALQHLGSLTKLQHLSISAADGWAAAGCPGLQELKALTSLGLASRDMDDLPASVSQLTALQQLEVRSATLTALSWLQALTGLTQLCVWEVTGLSLESPPLKLPGLRQLELHGDINTTMPMSFLASCTQLQLLKLSRLDLKGPGSLVASTMLQHLELDNCVNTAADGAAEPVSWQQVFPGPGQLQHLTSLCLLSVEPPLQQADICHVVALCSHLKVLGCDMIPSSGVPALVQLPALTNLQLLYANDEACSAVVELTGLRQLVATIPWQMSAVGLRQLAALQQLTSLGFGAFYSSKLNTLAQYLMKDNLPGCLHALTNKVCGKASSLVVCIILWVEAGR